MGPAQPASGRTLRRRIARPAVTARLRDALDHGALLVVADAGFGKTMALQEALDRRRQTAWVACTEAHRDAGRLVLAALEALRHAVPGAVDVLGERLMAGAGTVDPQLAAEQLVAELERLLVEPVVLILDDAERIADSPEAAALITALLAPRTRLRLAIASRRALMLKTAKLEASGQLTVLRSDDLAFTPEECAQFLAARLDREPLAEEVAAAMESTAGWPLGLELGATAGASFEGSRNATFAYLAEEVLGALDPGMRERVVESSVAPELSPPVIASLGLPDDFVAAAQRSGVFLRLVDGRRHAYAYHPLFREFLLDELQTTLAPADLRRLHVRAARGLAESDRLVDSVEHWLAAEAWDDAIAAIALASRELLRTSPGTLHAWLERVPPQERTAPPCLLIEGLLAWSAGEHERAIPLLRRAVSAHVDSGDVEGEWMARLTLTDAFFTAGAFDELDATTEGWQDVPPGRGCRWRRQARRSSASVCVRRLGPVRGGRRAAGPAQQAAHRSAVRPGRTDRAGVHGHRGRAVRAARRAASQAGIAALELSDPMGRLAYMTAGIALVHRSGAEYDIALPLVGADRRPRRCAPGLAFVARMSHFERALIFGLQGRLPEAELEIERAGPALGSGWRDHTIDKARAVIAGAGRRPRLPRRRRRARARGRSAAATNWQVWAAAELAPVLDASGAGTRARERVDGVLDTVDRQFPGERGRFHRARLMATRAGCATVRATPTAPTRTSGAASRRVATRPVTCCGGEWPRLEPIVWRAVERGLLDPVAVVRELEAAWPGGVGARAVHPPPAPGGAAGGDRGAAASGHPDAVGDLQKLADGR